MSKPPSLNGSNGRGAGGRFTRGNRGGPGNPHAKRTARLRAAILDATTEAEFKAVWRALVERAKAGDLAAIKEYLDRVIGKAPIAPDADDEADPPLRPIEEVVADIHRVIAAKEKRQNGKQNGK